MLTLYTRPGCQLCEKAKAMLERVGAAVAEHDISDDSALEAAYGTEIPVLADGTGRVLLRGVFTEPRLAAALLSLPG